MRVAKSRAIARCWQVHAGVPGAACGKRKASGSLHRWSEDRDRPVRTEAWKVACLLHCRPSHRPCKRRECGPGDRLDRPSQWNSSEAGPGMGTRNHASHAYDAPHKGTRQQHRRFQRRILHSYAVFCACGCRLPGHRSLFCQSERKSAGAGTAPEVGGSVSATGIASRQAHFRSRCHRSQQATPGGAEPRAEQGVVAAGPVHPDRTHGWWQDPDFVGLRPGTRGKARVHPRHLCHSVHKHRRADCLCVSRRATQRR